MALALQLIFPALGLFALACVALDLIRAARAWRGIKHQLEQEQAREYRFTIRQHGKGE